MASRDIGLLKEENVDVYNLLSIPTDSSDASIRKAYRKQALIYHPDKNKEPSAAVKFHRLTVALTVLTDSTLRKEYDIWLQNRKEKAIRDEQMGKDRKRMRDELELAEKRAKPSWNVKNPQRSQDAYALEVERLRVEGLRKRRELEQQHLSIATSISPEIKQSHSDNYPSTRTVKVMWKIKSGIAELFTEDVLEGIMGVFGDVESVKKLGKHPTEKKCELGIVVFKSAQTATEAVSYLPNEKSDLWEGTPYRKLSSILKRVEWYHDAESHPSIEEYKNQTLKKMRDYAKLSVES